MSNRAGSGSAGRLVSVAAVAALMAVAPACGNDSSRGNDRWVTTENTTVEIDWDAIGEAYKKAEGPEDFEEKVNEIYTGSEIISVAVHDLDEKTQEVTGFFDKNTDGQVEDGEKVFTIRRELTGADSGKYQMNGHGAYSHYRSPFWDIASGMALGYMVSRAFSPGYAPVYTRPYVTPASRHAALTSHRDGYRQKNPDKFQKTNRSGKSSKSGRSYGRKGNNYGGSRPTSSPRPRRSFGGGRFGKRRAPRGRVVRLEA